MKSLKLLVLFTVIGVLMPVAASAQQKRLSPHETISMRLEGRDALVTLTYGRPYSKKPGTTEVRKVWGGTLAPYGKAWRLGADEATLLVTQKPITIGDTTLEPGAYTLYMVPEEKEPSKLAISKAIGQWGIPVDEKHDVARVDLKKEALDPAVDQLAIALEKNPAGGGVLKIMWEDQQYSVPFALKK